jgi:hypothetical protein
MSWSVQTFKLASNQTDPGLFCAKDQLTLGGQPLLIQTDVGLRGLPLDQLQNVFDAAYGANAGIDAASRFACLQSVGRALGKGDMSHAAMLSLMLRLPEIDPDGMSRLRKITGTRIRKYDEDEPRDQQGQWTSGSRGGSPQASGRWPDRHRENPNIVPINRVLPIPIPLPPLMPGNPLNPLTPKPKPPYVLPPTSIPESGTGQGANDNARTDARAAANDDAKTCPDPSFEADSSDRTAAQLIYQTQISGLPPGMGTTLNGVKFDGCRESDGTMLEAKTTGAWFAFVPDSVFRTFKEYKETRDQAFRQIRAAGSREIEWHFSTPSAAGFWRREFSALNYRITVKYTPYTLTAVKFLL